MMKINVTFKKLKKPKRIYDVNILKDLNTALVCESCINKTIKSPTQNDLINIRWEAIKETIHNAANKIQDELFRLVNDIYITGEIPEDLRTL